MPLIDWEYAVPELFESRTGPNRVGTRIVRTDMRVAVDIEPVAAAGTRDNALVVRAQRGDQEAFAQLIGPRGDTLLRTARAILGNESDAYEAAQDALVAAWAQLPRLRDADRFDAWLNRTLVNKCRDALRKRKRVREIDVTETELAVPDAADAGIARAAVVAAFDRLSVEERHLLVLHHLYDMPLAQIARQLRIPLGTAKSRLWGARRHLERALEAER
jgi:RNA polymerase sigma-70 factor (ECF subfamily)